MKNFRNWLETTGRGVSDFVHRRPKVYRVRFHAKYGRSAVNYIGVVPCEIWDHGLSRASLKHIMKVAGLGLHWKPAGGPPAEEVCLLEMTLDGYHGNVIWPGVLAKLEGKKSKKPKKR